MGLQKGTLGSNPLYKVVDPINGTTKYRKNQRKEWEYGYDADEDIVIISKTGQIGEIYEIEGLKIALPLQPKEVYSRSDSEDEQYWQPFEYPAELKAIESMFEWNSYPEDFKEEWTPYIDTEFDRRENGFWFMNKGVPTWMPEKHYMYCQWSEIDIGLPDYREANRVFWIYWQACMADRRCFGMDYVKIRRSGFSNMAVADTIDEATKTYKSNYGILSMTNDDAKELFTDKLVSMFSKYPFFFKPLQDGMDKPQKVLSFNVPAEKLTKKKLTNKELADESDRLVGLETKVTFKPTKNNSFDGWKLKRLIHDESKKWTKPANILNNWKVTKTCLRIGRKIIGKCMMGSTVNPLSEGGAEGKELFYASKLKYRGKNGETPSGLYALFIPMEWNTEGFIDRHGMPVIDTPEEPIIGIDGELIEIGAVEWWDNQIDTLKNTPVMLNEFYRQFPRSEEHAFRDEAKTALFNINKIYEHIDYNGDNPFRDNKYTRGNFQWENGIKDSRVRFMPDKNGRFQIAWTPPANMQNKIINKNGLKYPANEHIGAFGCDPYDISGTVDGKGSKGSMHGVTKFSMENVPPNAVFLRYNARPQTSETFFEDILMALVFYGMPILAENNKPRLLYYLKKRGYRGYSMNPPHKTKEKMSQFEREVGGIANSGEDIIQAHAAAIETFVDMHVGMKKDGSYGDFPFNETLNDLVSFDLRHRGIHDDSISLGLAIMACNRMKYKPTTERKIRTIDLGFQKYSQDGMQSKIIK